MHWPVPQSRCVLSTTLQFVRGQTRTLAIRPEAILFEPPVPGRNSLSATVEEVNFLGAIVRIRARLGNEVISLDVFNNPHQTLPQRGTTVTLGFASDHLLSLEAA